MDLTHLSQIATEAALAAGNIIQQSMDHDITVKTKSGGTSYAAQVVTKVDLACEAIILSHLVPTCNEFDIAMLSEESTDDGSRLTKDFFWCIDPMDGTLAFINKRPGFSVSIALVAQDGTPYLGTVFDPCTKALYHAIKGQGVFKNGKPFKAASKNTHLTYVSDRKLKDTPRSEEVRKSLQKIIENYSLKGMEEINGSGSVMNAIHVLENGPACMIKLPKKEAGGGSLWDFAATACVYRELGLPATSYAGGRLDLNKKDGTFMNHQGVFYANL